MIKRKLFLELRRHLEKREITIIVGARQVGKTTLMKLLQEELGAKGERIVYLNLDIEADKQFVSSQEHLLKKISFEVGREKGYVFIDEIQRKENAGVFLKGLYDMNLPHKFIVSGSGSMELKERLHESLAGRKLVFELGTVSFEEWVDFKTDYHYEGRISEFLVLERMQAQQLLDEYLRFGGYPRVVLEDTIEEKRRIMAELYQSYIERDIGYFLGVRDTNDFTTLVRCLASQIGQIVSVAELSRSVGISVATIKHYLWYLEKTFLVTRVTPYFRNRRKELIKAPMFYFNDLGMRNYATGSFGTAHQSAELGLLFQNSVFNILKDRGVSSSVTPVRFWRTTDKAEVDFVVEHGSGIIPIEAKHHAMKRPVLTRSFRSFLERYHPRQAYIVNLTFSDEEKIGETLVRFIPYHQLLGGLPPVA